MRACGRRENRRERALRIFHLVRERATVALFSPLVFCAGGVVVVRSFYKSNRRGLVSFLLLSQKSPCLMLSLRAPCVWKPCSDRAKRRWRPSPRGVGRDGTYARGLGGRARRCLRPSPRGVGRDGTRARGQGVGRAVIWARDRGVRRAGARSLVSMDGLLRLFAIFNALIWVCLFMVPNTL